MLLKSCLTTSIQLGWWKIMPCISQWIYCYVKECVCTGLRIEAQQQKVCLQTEKSHYPDSFFESQDLIVNALDNVEARRYVDRYLCFRVYHMLFENHNHSVWTQSVQQLVCKFVAIRFETVWNDWPQYADDTFEYWFKSSNVTCSCGEVLVVSCLSLL